MLGEVNERLWCAACQMHAPPEQETGDCMECGASCWTSKDAWLGRQAAEQFIQVIAALSPDGLMEGLHSVNDRFCLGCGFDRDSSSERHYC